MTALVIQTAFLGDVVLTTPLLAALAARHGPVDVVTTPAGAALLESHPAVRQVIRYDKRGNDRGLRGLRRLARALRAAGYHAAYLPHRSWRSGALAVLARIPVRIGFADSPAALSYTRRVPRARTGHEVERLLALDGGGMAAPPVALALTGDEEAAADRWLAARGIASGFVALAPGSIWGTKRWPYYADLARALAEPVVVIGGPDDAALAASVAEAAGSLGHNAAGALTLRASAALIRRASVLVTNDSAPLHLATATATPTVALFGPTVPEFGFGPRGTDDTVLGIAGLECRPCSAHGPQTCPRGHHRCMRDLTVTDVVAAIARTRHPR